MYAIAGYLLIVIYASVIGIAIFFLLMILTVILTSINGIIADRKYYNKK